MQVGDIQLLPVSDGWFHMPKEFFPGADWSGHEDLFDHDGRQHVDQPGRQILAQCG